MLGEFSGVSQAFSRIYSVRFGERVRLARSGQRPADQTIVTEGSQLGSRAAPRKPSAGRRRQRPGRSRSPAFNGIVQIRSK